MVEDVKKDVEEIKNHVL
nr:hypothetical protein [Clostridium faecium]